MEYQGDVIKDGFQVEDWESCLKSWKLKDGVASVSFNNITGTCVLKGKMLGDPVAKLDWISAAISCYNSEYYKYANTIKTRIRPTILSGVPRISIKCPVRPVRQKIWGK